MTFKKFSPQNSSIILNILSYRICVPIQFRNRNDFPKFVSKIDLNGIEVTDFQITISPLFSLYNISILKLSKGYGGSIGFPYCRFETAFTTTLLTYGNVLGIVEIAVTPHRSRSSGWSLDLIRRWWWWCSGRSRASARGVNEERAKDYERRKLLSILVIFRGAPHEQNVAHLSVACNRPHARPIKPSVIDGNEPFIPPWNS